MKENVIFKQEKQNLFSFSGSYHHEIIERHFGIVFKWIEFEFRQTGVEFLAYGLFSLEQVRYPSKSQFFISKMWIMRKIPFS